MAAPHVLVVSLRKSGTHLIREVVKRLGYAVQGQVFLQDIEQPVLGPDAVWRVLNAVYPPEEVERLQASEDRAEIDAAIAQALAAVMRAWRCRLGLRPGSAGELLTRAVLQGDEPLVRALTRPEAARFDIVPGNTAWFLHQLDLHAADPGFLRSWAVTGSPQIIFNYRDPRDVLLSMVTYLTSEEPEKLRGFPEHRIYRDILLSRPTLDERLTLALTDPEFPGVRTMESSLWLLRHPAVVKVSFEELAGPHGGGSAEAQRAAVARITGCLETDTDTDVGALAEGIFSSEAFTFRSGKIGRWREEFGPHHKELFQERHGHLLEPYGCVS